MYLKVMNFPPGIFYLISSACALLGVLGSTEIKLSGKAGSLYQGYFTSLAGSAMVDISASIVIPLQF